MDCMMELPIVRNKVCKEAVMNAQLLNPFANDIPERVDVSWEAAASVVRFNPLGLNAGNYVAVGRQDGLVTVYDLETRGLLRLLEGHVKTITSVCWSRHSRYLLSASLDWNCVIWDLRSGERVRTVRFDAPVIHAVFHPRNCNIILATLETQQAVFVDLQKSPKLASCYKRWDLLSAIDDAERTETGGEEGAGPSRRQQITIARFSPDGRKIFAGTSKGAVVIFDVAGREVENVIRVSGSSSIREVAFDRPGRTLVTNSNDRVVRVFAVSTPRVPRRRHDRPKRRRPQSSSDSETLSPAPVPGGAGTPSGADEGGEGDEEDGKKRTELVLLHKFQDLVNRTPWNGIGFSGDGEYVVGGAGHKAAHNVYIWDRGGGTLVKILDGPTEPLAGVDWHPTRPLIMSISPSGLLYLWTTPVTETWSAYAPGFEELEENVDYMEREDEFDLEDEDLATRRQNLDESHLVDITFVLPTSHNADDPASSRRRRRRPATTRAGGAGFGLHERSAANSDGPDGARRSLKSASAVDPPNEGAGGGVNVKGAEEELGAIMGEEEEEKEFWETDPDRDDDPTFFIPVRLEDEFPDDI